MRHDNKRQWLSKGSSTGRWLLLRLLWLQLRLLLLWLLLGRRRRGVTSPGSGGWRVRVRRNGNHDRQKRRVRATGRRR